MNPDHLLQYVIRPVLDSLQAGGDRAERLLLMIAAHESRFKYIQQIGGPARGYWQMEPDTLRDLWKNWLDYRPSKANILSGWGVRGIDHESPDQLYVPQYACCAARLYLMRFPEPFPETDAGLAEYAKKFWNTEAGAAAAEDYLMAYQGLVL